MLSSRCVTERFSQFEQRPTLNPNLDFKTLNHKPFKPLNPQQPPSLRCVTKNLFHRRCFQVTPWPCQPQTHNGPLLLALLLLLIFIVDTILIPAIILSITILLSSVLLLVIRLLLLITTRNRNILIARVISLLKICGVREYTSGHKSAGKKQHKCSECSTPKAGMTTDIECFGVLFFEGLLESTRSIFNPYWI